MDAKTAKMAYRPLGLGSSVLGGAVAGVVVKQVWRHLSDNDDAPSALQAEYPWRDVLVAAGVQGAVFGVVKAVIDRFGAQAFERLTGHWPGD